jgi:hypothetical protein
VAFEELDSLRSGDHYTLLNLPRRIEHENEDPWADFFKVKQVLPSGDGPIRSAEPAASPARKRPAQKAPARKAAAKKSPARKVPAKKTAARKRG